MLIFDQYLEEDCEFKTTKETKNFLISFFGFYPHQMAKRFESFILETGVVEMSNHDKIPMDKFVLNGEFGIQVSDQFDSRTFDPTIVLPKTFNSKLDAIKWFNGILGASCNLDEKDVCSIDVIDGDKLMNYIIKETTIENKKQKARAEINEELKFFKESLLEDYEDNEFAVDWINKKLKV